MSLVFNKRSLVLVVSLKVDFPPLDTGHTLHLILVEVFPESVPMFVLCTFRSGSLEAIPCRPDTPHAFPVFQSDIVGTRPFSCGSLVASFVEMFFDAFLFHVQCSFFSRGNE